MLAAAWSSIAHDQASRRQYPSFALRVTEAAALQLLKDSSVEAAGRVGKHG